MCERLQTEFRFPTCTHLHAVRRCRRFKRDSRDRRKAYKFSQFAAVLKWFSSFSRALVYGDFQKVAQIAWHEDRALEAQKIVEILGEEKQILVREFLWPILQGRRLGF